MRAALSWSLVTLCAFTLAMPSQPGPRLLGRSTNIQCNKGDDAVRAINAEISILKDMADFTSAYFTDEKFENYYNSFIPELLRGDKEAEKQLRTVFRKMAGIWDAKKGDYEVTVTCDGGTESCKRSFAHFSEKDKRINLCDTWFDTRRWRVTTDAITDCQQGSEKAKCKTLEDFAMTRAFTLAHEITHAKWVMTSRQGSKDFAYTVKDCMALAEGKLDRSKTWYKDRSEIMCPDPRDDKKEGICNERHAIDNAESIALVAAGVYFRAKCGWEFPLKTEFAPLSARADAPFPGDDDGNQCVAQINVQLDVPPVEVNYKKLDPLWGCTEPKNNHFSNREACDEQCGGEGRCESGSAGFPQPMAYYFCVCPR